MASTHPLLGEVINKLSNLKGGVFNVGPAEELVEGGAKWWLE